MLVLGLFVAARRLGEGVARFRRDAVAAPNAERFQSARFDGAVDGEWPDAQLRGDFLNGVNGCGHGSPGGLGRYQVRRLRRYILRFLRA